MRLAITDYEMIQTGDKIALGFSGGKDSQIMALALKKLSLFLPEKFDVVAICVDLGFDSFDRENIRSFCDTNEISLHIEETSIAKIVFDIKRPKSPCALCSNLRRGALINAAKKLDCNKVALGHHMDDAIETFYLSMLYEGRISIFSPSTYLTNSNLTVIRPLVYIEEKEIIRFVEDMDLHPSINPCKMDGSSRRKLVGELLKDIYEINPAFRTNMFNTILNSGVDGWHKKNRSPGFKK